MDLKQKQLVMQLVKNKGVRSFEIDLELLPSMWDEFTCTIREGHDDVWLFTIYDSALIPIPKQDAQKIINDFSLIGITIRNRSYFKSRKCWESQVVELKNNIQRDKRFIESFDSNIAFNEHESKQINNALTFS